MIRQRLSRPGQHSIGSNSPPPTVSRTSSLPIGQVCQTDSMTQMYEIYEVRDWKVWLRQNIGELPGLALFGFYAVVAVGGLGVVAYEVLKAVL
jgi:hypothetical protein